MTPDIVTYLRQNVWIVVLFCVMLVAAITIIIKNRG